MTRKFEAFLVRVSFFRILFGPLTILFYVSTHIINSLFFKIGNSYVEDWTKYQITGIREYSDPQRIRSFVQILFIYCVV